MPIIDAKDAQDVDNQLQSFFESNPAERPQRLRQLFTEKFDFNTATGKISLAEAPKNVTLPSDAERIASMEGINVVYVPLEVLGTTRVRKAEAATAARMIARQLGDDMLLLISNQQAEGEISQLHMILPTFAGSIPALRRMVVERYLPRRTTIQQLSNIYHQWRDKGGLRLTLEEAFNVEAVTKSFFTQYQNIFERVQGLIKGFPGTDDGREVKKLFVQALFNRLMFIYFLSRKSWLKFKGDPDYLAALWKDFREGKDAKSFYEERLKPLFFNGLNNPRSADLVKENEQLYAVIGDVPFLNGGLFAEEEYDRRSDITIPDEAFSAILHDLFDNYNFTVMENTPLDVEVAVDPEMLGKIFEELVTGRHKTGSYYTPKTVVSFMCREALKGYLGGYEKLIDNHDTSNINITEARELISKLKRITVCDPACGSGAYLVGMLHELQNLHRLLDTRVVEMTTRDDYQLKLEIIQNNLYGVDIDSFAINIARLRLWLSLAVEYEGDKPEPLPNLDYKIEIGDSLIAPIPESGEKRQFRTELIKQFKDKKADFLKTYEPGPKHALREEIRQLRETVAQWTQTGEVVHDFDWAIDFVEVFDDGGFDIAIANPPYGLSCEDPLRFQYFPRKKDEDTQSKDSYGLFMARALQLLKPGGFFTFIVSDTWRTIRSHRPLRAKLLQDTTVYHVLDLPAWIFEATVNTCILSLRKQPPLEEHNLIAVDLRTLPVGDWTALEANLAAIAMQIPDVQTTTYARYTYPQRLVSTYDNLSFFISSPNLYRLMSDERFVRLSELADVKQGLATADNKYYLCKRTGAHGGYQILDESKLLSDDEINNLTEQEKHQGVNPTKYSGRYFAPYDKGGQSDSDEGWLPNYYVPTQYFIDWSENAVHRIKTYKSSIQGDRIASRFQNFEYYFRAGITFSDTGFYAPTFRAGCSGVFDVMGMTIFSDTVHTNVLLSILPSKLARYIIKNYINHTVHTQVDGLKPVPIRTDEAEIVKKLTSLVGSIMDKQKSDPRYSYHLYEQKEIDALVYQLYGLSEEDIRDVEFWYCRRYPKLAEAQGLLTEVLQKYSSYLARCELILSKPPGYWKSNPILQLIAQGEGPSLEFKETLEADTRTGEKYTVVLTSALKTIAAFLNTDGGTLLVGVSDSGEIKGLEKDFRLCSKHDADGLEQKLRSLLRDRFRPDPIGKVEIRFVNLPEGDICQVDVQPATDISYLDGRDVFVRDGNISRKLEGPTLVSWVKRKAIESKP